MRQVHLRLDDIQYEELNNYTKSSGLSVQDCIREAVYYYITDRKKPPSAGQNRFRFIDLFAGIGGMRLAFEHNGGQCVYSSEWDKYCQATYFANFGELPNGDITKVAADNIPDHDILVSCQLLNCR